METQTKLERPVFDKKMVKKLAIEVAPILKSASRYNSIETRIEDAEYVLEDNYDDNGYELAKHFEEKGYDITPSIVEDLDYTSHLSSQILKEEIKKWVAKNDVKLELPIGCKVTVDLFRKNNETGEIVKLYPETAQYGVRTSEQSETSHYLIDFEKIKSVIK